MEVSLTSVAPTDDEMRKVREVGGIEFVRGKFITKVKSVRTCAIISDILFRLHEEAAKTQEASVFSCTLGYQCLPDDPSGFRKPDLSVLRTDRLIGLDWQAPLIAIPPDLAVEVISPEELADDLADRVEDYLRSGVKLVWTVIPQTKTVMIYRADGSVTRLHENDEIAGECALSTLKCRVGEFFVDLS